MDVRIFDDTFEVSDNDGYYIGSIYAEDDEEAIEKIKELLEEEE